MLMFRSESTLCHGQGNVKAFPSHQNSTTCRGTTLLHKWITVKKKIMSTKYYSKNYKYFSNLVPIRCICHFCFWSCLLFFTHNINLTREWHKETLQKWTFLSVFFCWLPKLYSLYIHIRKKYLITMKCTQC